MYTHTSINTYVLLMAWFVFYDILTLVDYLISNHIYT